MVLVMATVLAAGANFALQNNLAAISLADPISSNEENQNLPPPLPEKLANPPQVIKAVYVTGWSAGSARYLNYLADLFETTGINAVVVDIKDYSGKVSYNSMVPEVKEYGLSNYAISDIDGLVRFLHGQNIYVIGRISVFEDPAYSKIRSELAIFDKGKGGLWRDNNKLSWLDPASEEVWEYTVLLAKDALDKHGFDEINFDYVRFPSDGDVENMGFPIWDGKTTKADVIKNFFDYLRSSLPDEKISVDLFGQTTVNADDMGIGQIIENAFENFDYISPMVYPSHYAGGFGGYENPAEHPYEIVKYSMDSAFTRMVAYKYLFSSAGEVPQEPLATGKFRPWLQDFNMGADYTANMVEQEIQAVQDSLGKEYTGFMLWNPSNVYTSGVVLK